MCGIAFIALNWVVSPIWAATIIFAFWLVVALCVFFVGRTISAKRRKIYEEQMNEERANLVAASLVAAIPAILKDKKTLTVAIPLIGLAALLFWNSDKNTKS